MSNEVLKIRHESLFGAITGPCKFRHPFLLQLRETHLLVGAIVKRMSKLQPNLENKLVRIRPLRKEDFEPLFQVAKDPLIWEQHPANRYKKDQFESFFKDSMESAGALVIIDKMSNEVIGSSRFKELSSVENAVEIGWSFLARKYWGGQYNGTIKSLMIDYAFSYFDTVIFYIGSDNIRSQKAVEKIGALRTSEKRYQSSTPNNDLTYSINKMAWIS